MGLQMKAALLDAVRQQILRDLEKELGVQLVALHPENQLAQLSKQQSQRLEVVERELGVSLVAYESTAPLRLARPSVAQQTQIEKVEKDTKLVLVAYEVVEEPPAEFLITEKSAKPAKLADDKRRRLQTIEEQTGLTLMAYQWPSGKTA